MFNILENRNHAKVEAVFSIGKIEYFSKENLENKCEEIYIIG